VTLSVIARSAASVVVLLECPILGTRGLLLALKGVFRGYSMGHSAEVSL
jgi:hypothetical protein